MASLTSRILEQPRAYIALARPDHWLKNVAMLPGVLLAAFYHPQQLSPSIYPVVAWAVLATCLVAWANYVLNEILDAHTDLYHPFKRHRPLPSGTGRVRLVCAYAEWLGLAALGLN